MAFIFHPKSIYLTGSRKSHCVDFSDVSQKLWCFKITVKFDLISIGIMSEAVVFVLIFRRYSIFSSKELFTKLKTSRALWLLDLLDCDQNDSFKTAHLCIIAQADSYSMMSSYVRAIIQWKTKLLWVWDFFFFFFSGKKNNNARLISASASSLKHFDQYVCNYLPMLDWLSN